MAARYELWGRAVGGRPALDLEGAAAGERAVGDAVEAVGSGDARGLCTWALSPATLLDGLVACGVDATVSVRCEPTKRCRSRAVRMRVS